MFNYASEREGILRLAPFELMGRMGALKEEGSLGIFLEEASRDCAMTAHVSYWEKWFTEDARREIDRAMRREDAADISDDVSLPLHLEEIYSGQELRTIFSSVGAIQLTFGCSKSCPRCGFDAVPDVREVFPFPLLRNMFKQFGPALTMYNRPERDRPILYWASEPSDYVWTDGKKLFTYKDVHVLAGRYAGYAPSITTREYVRRDWVRFLRKVKDKRLSVYGMSSKEAREVARAVMPAAKKNKKTEADFIEENLVGADQAHMNGIGRSFSFLQEDSRFGLSGIGCFNGLLLSPRGLYNLFQVPISHNFPQGQMVIPLERITETPVRIGDPLQQIMREKILFVDFTVIDKEAGFVKYAKPIVRCEDRFLELTLSGDYRVEGIERIDYVKTTGMIL
jgi:hypothetical protein